MTGAGQSRLGATLTKQMTQLAPMIQEEDDEDEVDKVLNNTMNSQVAPHSEGVASDPSPAPGKRERLVENRFGKQWSSQASQVSADEIQSMGVSPIAEQEPSDNGDLFAS